jgi:hypothetical protein
LPPIVMCQRKKFTCDPDGPKEHGVRGSHVLQTAHLFSALQEP